MPVFILEQDIHFPPVEMAEPDGLLAIGGDLSEQRLTEAYRHGIFPWYEGEHILWWCPHPRFVLFPEKLKVSRSMKALLKKNTYQFTINKNFAAVIHNCKNTPRAGQPGTWITDEVEKAYTHLHNKGIAHSAECWYNKELVGGVYGIRMGNVFFGESMFSHRSNASKFAFINYVQHLQQQGVQLIDCQIYTEHLESLGAEMIDRKKFIHLLDELIK